MLNRKLLEILSRLTPPEKRQLRLFLQSPYFNNSRQADQLLALYDDIDAHDAEEEHPALQKEVISRKFFPDKPFREKEKGPVDSLGSQLLQLVRIFLIQQYDERQRTTLNENLPLLQFYRKFGLDDRFWQTVQAVRKLREEVEQKDARYFLDQFWIEDEVSNFEGMSNTYEDDVNIITVNYYLDCFFSTLKLEYACAFTHQYRSSQIDSTDSSVLTKAVIKMAEDNNLPPIPIIQAYEKTLKMLVGQTTESDLDELAEILKNNRLSISEDKFRDLQTYYRSFWGRQYLHSGDTIYKQKLFEVFENHLTAGYFYIDQKIPPISYRLLLSIGLKVNKFDWVKNLLDEHPPERICGTKYPNEVYSLNTAEFYFNIKEYDKATLNLTYKPFENPGFSLIADVLLIKIYFETENDLLDSRMKALDQKIRRTKFSNEAKSGYYNFLKKLDKIIKYGWQKESPKREKLVEEIKSQPNIVAREWLLAQLGPKTPKAAGAKVI